VLAAVGIVVATTPLGGFPAGVFVLDALLCMAVIGASRFGERALFRARSTLRERDARRTLIVGAGRSGRSLVRELRETPGERVVGFVDDDPRLHRRRLLGVPVRGGTLDIERILAAAHPDAVLVTIPQAPAERLDGVVRACSTAGVPCRFVRRETDLDPVAVLGATPGSS
jgi:FlaA1/EpsC-like NDP-sugar epimerase